MQIFEYPYIVLTIIAICFVAIAGFGIYFAMKGLKAADGHTGNDFVSISKMESNFISAGKQRENRCIIYITVSSENLHSASSEQSVFSKIKAVFLESFSEDRGGMIALYGEKNFVAMTDWNAQTAETNLENCRNELNKCLLEHNQLNVVDVKMGVYMATGIPGSFDEAINRSNQACVLAKNEKQPYAYWDISSGKALEKKIKIENTIEREIDNNRFFLEYQPVLDAKTKKIVGAEVLSRLNSESDGVLTPRSFLSAVGSVGLNGKFDYYIFEKNCKWISNDKKQRESYKYTINFSRATICEPGFVEKIVGIAEKYDLKLSCLAVEILEDKDVTGAAREQMIENLTALKGKGVSVLLDDFGNGFTSFGDLQNLDISVVKIDKTIVANSVTDTGFVILKNIIQTSKDIGYMTLCEGVETAQQEEAAIKAGCDFLQGFYYYRPMSVSMFEKLFENHADNA